MNMVEGVSCLSPRKERDGVATQRLSLGIAVL
jgi:hypothetical protein